MPVIDFSGVKELEALPDDTYRCIIGDVSREKPTDPKKHEYYKVKFSVSDEDSEYKGRSLYRNYSLSPQSLWALKQFMIVAGTDPEVFAGEVDTDEEMTALKGAEVDVVATTKPYGDKMVNEVVKVSPPGF